ncbi:19597_t:CDS:2 [Funneliformis geosporum]|uniref:19597_t:CDS:1 n=1 Tax=Funneliformis geosporum TaxID=1117311 RepID=A0A9W4SP98_9GLOM|nr:19597_t:CDS:2 [Funneliformis geosporum]
MFITIYDIVVFFFNVVLDNFFREIKSRGSHKIPMEGPVIFVAAPHANQFVDPLNLMRNTKRRVSFLIAEKSMKRKYIGAMARAVHAIPVARPQDLAKQGIGKIHLDDRKTDPLRITGIGTEFTKQFKVGFQIALPNDCGSSEVTNIVSDTDLLIKKEFKDLNALEMLTNPEGTSFKCLPHVDQSQVYKAVFETLNAGNCIGIFPEGGSHDRTEILPLKAGVTIMALGAMAANPKLDVKIVPCGLNYFHAHSFRSRAVVEFGTPISISPELVGKYRKGGMEKREACGKLLDCIYTALRSVTVNTPDYETLMVIQAARRLYKPEHHKLELSDVIELNRRFVTGYMKFKDDPRVQEMNEKVMAYNQLLKYHGLKDHQVHRTGLGGIRAFILLIYRLFVLIIWAIIGFPGFILNIPLITITRVISAKKAKEALKSSTIKVAARDVLATWKLLVALVVMPILYGFYTFITLSLAYKYDWKILQLHWWTPMVVYIFFFLVSNFTMHLADSGLDVYRSLRPLFLSLLPWSQSSIQNLRAVREQLSNDLTDLINELGPKIYPNFDNSRLVRELKRKSRSPSPSSSRPQSYQMRLFPLADFLDDKVFDWSRADDSDYDDVFFFLDKQHGNVVGRSRTNSSGQNSTRTRSRASSFNSNVSSEGGGRNSGGFRVDAFTELSKDKALSEVNKRPTSSIPKVEINNYDDDSGYHGDKEIEPKKSV